MKDNYMYVKGGENTFMPDDDDPQMPAEGLEAIGGLRSSPAGTDGDRLFDRELLSSALGHWFLGAGFRRLGLPEPYHRPARFGAGPV